MAYVGDEVPTPGRRAPKGTPRGKATEGTPTRPASARTPRRQLEEDPVTAEVFGNPIPAASPRVAAIEPLAVSPQVQAIGPPRARATTTGLPTTLRERLVAEGKNPDAPHAGTWFPLGLVGPG